MLTREENDRLCRIGPGTPMGAGANEPELKPQAGSAYRVVKQRKVGAPDTIRTCDLCLRSKITCPSEKCDRARYTTLSS
jgi:hypothetical protein